MKAIDEVKWSDSELEGELVDLIQFPRQTDRKDKGQSWGFTSRSTARVILGQVLRNATCGTRTHRGDSL